MLGLFSFFASCSDDEYTPASEISADNPQVYFSNQNSEECVVTSDGNADVSLKLKRVRTDGTITVPIIVEEQKGNVVVPSDVTFADGQDEAELSISCTNYEPGTTITLRIDDDYANPYSIVAGSTKFTLIWTEVSKLCDVVYYTTDGLLDKVKDSAIYYYAGQNKFVWKNFLGSGQELKFRVDVTNSGAKFDANDLSSLSGDIIPLSNYTTVDYGWLFTEGKETENLIGWTPEGAEEAVTDFFFYGYSTTYNYSYSYITFDTSYYGTCAYGWFYNSYFNTYTLREDIYFYLYF